MKIRVASELPNIKRAGGYRQWVTKLAMMRWNVVPHSWEPHGTVLAYVIRSNWVADCPHCAGTIVVDPDDLFWCPDCAMQNGDGYPLRVIMPKERAEIERLLMRRPNPMTRNWLLNETVQDLSAENEEHGLGE